MPVLASAVGSVEPINSVAVKSLIDGQILESLVKDGDDVKQNQLLFRIDPRPAEAALKQAQAAQAKDEATLAQARSQVKRNEAIAEKGYISADQMEQFRTNCRRGGGERESRSGQCRRDEGHARLHRNPFADRRPHRPHPDPARQSREGERHQRARRHQPDRADLRQLRAAGSQLGPVLVGQRASPLAVDATVAGVAKPIEGKVAFVDNAVDTTTGTVKLRAEFANPEHLLWPGQLVSVSLTLGRSQRDRAARSRGAERPRWHVCFRREVRPARRAAQGRRSSAWSTTRP